MLTTMIRAIPTTMIRATSLPSPRLTDKKLNLLETKEEAAEAAEAVEEVEAAFKTKSTPSAPILKLISSTMKQRIIQQ